MGERVQKKSGFLPASQGYKAPVATKGDETGPFYENVVTDF